MTRDDDVIRAASDDQCAEGKTLLEREREAGNREGALR